VRQLDYTQPVAGIAPGGVGRSQWASLRGPLDPLDTLAMRPLASRPCNEPEISPHEWRCFDLTWRSVVCANWTIHSLGLVSHQVESGDHSEHPWHGALDPLLYACCEAPCFQNLQEEL